MTDEIRMEITGDEANTHDCPERATATTVISNFGHRSAITSIDFQDGHWWACVGDEYDVAIYYCPFCGLKLAQEATA